jgi:hypothetical protein
VGVNSNRGLIAEIARRLRFKEDSPCSGVYSRNPASSERFRLRELTLPGREWLKLCLSTRYCQSTWSSVIKSSHNGWGQRAGQTRVRAWSSLMWVHKWWSRVHNVNLSAAGKPLSLKQKEQYPGRTKVWREVIKPHFLEFIEHRCH